MAVGVRRESDRRRTLECALKNTVNTGVLVLQNAAAFSDILAKYLKENKDQNRH